jgi:hypothetical protein
MGYASRIDDHLSIKVWKHAFDRMRYCVSVLGVCVSEGVSVCVGVSISPLFPLSEDGDKPLLLPLLLLRTQEIKTRDKSYALYAEKGIVRWRKMNK